MHALQATPASTRVDVGITNDFEFTPDQPGELVLDVDHRVPGHPTRVRIIVAVAAPVPPLTTD